jgi:outer membrane protein
MNKVFYKYLVVVGILFVGSIKEVSAQNIKVGYINTDELLIALPEVKAANDSLMADREKHEKKMTAMMIELRKKATALEGKKNNIAPIQYEKEVELIKAEEQKIMEMDELGKRELQVKSEGFSKPLEERVNTAIKAIAAEEGYTYIMNSNMGLVLYAQDSANVLDKVKAKLLAGKK